MQYWFTTSASCARRRKASRAASFMAERLLATPNANSAAVMLDIPMSTACLAKRTNSREGRSLMQVLVSSRYFIAATWHAVVAARVVVALVQPGSNCHEPTVAYRGRQARLSPSSSGGPVLQDQIPRCAFAAGTRRNRLDSYINRANLRCIVARPRRKSITQAPKQTARSAGAQRTRGADPMTLSLPRDSTTRFSRRSPDYSWLAYDRFGPKMRRFPGESRALRAARTCARLW